MPPADLFERAAAAEAAGRLDEAEQLCRHIIAQAPQHAGALLIMGIVRTKKGDLANALPLLARSLSIMPQVALGQFYHGAVLAGLGRAQEALASYGRAVQIDPDLAEAHYQSGHLLLALGRLPEALGAFERTIAVRPDFIAAQGARGVVLAQLGRTDEALAAFDGVLAKFPGEAWVLTARGKLHLECERTDAALTDLNRSLALGETQDALVNRALAHRAQRRLDDAQADIDRAMAMNPNSAYALFVRGLMHTEFGRLEQALADYSRVVALQPNDVAALTNLGGTLFALGQILEALAAFNRAIEIDGKFAKAYFGRGDVWRRLAHEEKAIADFDHAAELNPALTMDRTQRLHLSETICDWNGREARIDDLKQRVARGEPILPGIMLSVLDDPAFHLAAAKLVADPPASDPVVLSDTPHERLRIAYLSPDYREHVLTCQIVELIERHDKTRFEVFGISLADWPSGVTLERLEKAFEHFIRVGKRSDREIAELVASLGIDIVVDLAGYTDRHRAKVFSYRPAPISVSYLGYPGTMGGANIDYVLADAVTIPPENEPYFSECVARLPDCFFPSDTGMPCVEEGTRVEAGLPETGFVFCGFNNAFKLSPRMFDVWMRLLATVDGSVLWLNIVNETARGNLRTRAKERGVPPERIIFAGREHFRWRHVARLRFADLHLDCLPYNAHSTCADSLLAGVPVLTCQGRAFAGRVAASMLTCLDMPELIANDPEDYERIALELARSPEAMAAVRTKLRQRRVESPLFDMGRLAANIERAYEIMWQRYRDGGAPQTFTVPRT